MVPLLWQPHGGCGVLDRGDPRDMIEFRAECGHTVRADDDAAGGVVRCSYCGTQVEVPDGEARSLDYLFRDVEQPSDEPKKRKRKRRKPKRKSASGGGAAQGIDLVAIIMRMCYAAFLLSVVIFVGDRYVMPHFRESEVPPERVDAGAVTDPDHELPVRRIAPGVPSTPRLGLVTRQNAIGLYVSSTPPSAVAYCLDESRAPDTGRIHDIKGSAKVLANGTSLSVADGTYVVEVVLPWNDPNLNDSALPYFSRYREFRRAIEYASDEKRRDLLEEYFVPDGAAEVFIDQTPDQIYIVRRFAGIRVRDGRSHGVRALFLPKVADERGGAFSIQSLVEHYLPKEKVYWFNRAHVQSELDYYGVPLTDREAILEALAIVGTAPYVTRDGRTRLFSIGINDGAFSARIIRDDAG